MQLSGTAVVLLAILSTACGLRCYTCDHEHCNSYTTCLPFLFDRCYSLDVGNGIFIKGCQNKNTCIYPMSCCEGDLCNAANHTGASLILLLASTAMAVIFL